MEPCLSQLDVKGGESDQNREMTFQRRPQSKRDSLSKR